MFSLTHLQFLSLLFKEKSQFLQLPLLPQSPGAVPVGCLGVMTMGEEATVNRRLGNGFSAGAEAAAKKWRGLINIHES